MNNFELYKVLVGMDLRLNSVRKGVKSVGKSCFLLSICMLGTAILLDNHEKRLSILEKNRVENLKKEFEMKEKSAENDDLDDEIELDLE